MNSLNEIFVIVDNLIPVPNKIISLLAKPPLTNSEWSYFKDLLHLIPISICLLELGRTNLIGCTKILII